MNKTKKDAILYLIIPCYNEEDTISYSSKILKEKLESLIKDEKISKDSKIFFVDDGSKDKTWQMICELNKKEKIFSGISLMKNEGQQMAIMAGLNTVKNYADMAIVMDVDLQDDVDAIDEMVRKFYEGYDVVYGVRKERKKDTFFKRKTAESFYKIMKFLGAKTIYNHSEFRLMSKKVLEVLEKYTERNIFLRGLVTDLKFKHSFVYYSRKERKLGETKYPTSKMLDLAFNGIVSCSTKLINIIFLIGIIFLTLSFFTVLMSFISNFLYSIRERIILLTMFLTTGLILTSLGIIGKYVAIIFMEVKKRPRYFISENLNENLNNKTTQEKNK